ncbi:hypothetical protein K438DRAFT_1757932 [Mycena galopus ATCC 62051]|nr:hypothetical protein K438DRAFT_1757932 [Mycena galopus ATCC 62051]
MAQSLASESTSGALDTLNQLGNTSTILRTEIGCCTWESGIVPKFAQEQLNTDSSRAWMGLNLDHREEPVRPDEKERRHPREELAEQLEKIGKSLEAAASQARRRVEFELQASESHTGDNTRFPRCAITSL